MRRALGRRRLVNANCALRRHGREACVETAALAAGLINDFGARPPSGRRLEPEHAVFPLSLAVHTSGDAKAISTAVDAVERINIALKDATTDAISGRVEYRSEASLGRAVG